ncbi:hypothetical protein BDR05DRAFT_954296 [Suillus weaverae]|nr:hypothetical protein BDR05DRAFT_954296 [Suillus weaverae]
MLGSNDITLALPRDLRRKRAEIFILGLSSLHLAPASGFSREEPLAASDASMIPSPASFLQARSITSAAATPSSRVSFSLMSHGPSAGILHGELLGIISAVLLSIHDNPSKPYPVLTDHKNAVLMIADVLPSALPHVWNAQPARSLYHWLLMLIQTVSPSPSISWTAAHTGGQTSQCLANDYVDHMASAAQHSCGVVASAPLATFTMDDYALFSSDFGFLECNVSLFVISRLESTYASSNSFHPAQAWPLALYDCHSLPDFPYTRASSSFSAIVQLYAQSSQLDTAQVRHRRFRDMPPWCHFGCDAFESTHHIFALYPAFMAIRRAHNVGLCDETSSLLEGKTTDHIREVFGRAAQRLFSDDAGLWPQYRTCFYVGVLPPLTDIAADVRPYSDISGNNSFSDNVGVPSPRPSRTTLDARLLSRLAQVWHVRSIRLAGHIWGEYKRRVRALHAGPTSSPTDSSLTSYSYLLPDTLRFLI